MGAIHEDLAASGSTGRRQPRRAVDGDTSTIVGSPDARSATRGAVPGSPVEQRVPRGAPEGAVRRTRGRPRKAGGDYPSSAGGTASHVARILETVRVLQEEQAAAAADRIGAVRDPSAGDDDRDGVTLSDVRDAYQRVTGAEAPERLGGMLSSLRGRGLLAVVGGRAGAYRYAVTSDSADRDAAREDAQRAARQAREARPPAGPWGDGEPIALASECVWASALDADDARTLHALLEAGRTQDRAEVVVREVEAAYRRLVEGGAPPLRADHPGALRQRLERLARPARRGPAAGEPPLVELVRVDGALRGQTRVFWRIRPGAPIRLAAPLAEPGITVDARPAEPETSGGATAAAPEAPAARPKARWFVGAPIVGVPAATAPAKGVATTGVPIASARPGTRLRGALDVQRSVVVRQAVQIVTARCRRPVSMIEVRWWQQQAVLGTTSPPLAATALPEAQLGQVLLSTARADSKARRDRPGRLHTVESPYGGWGAMPLRYCIDEPTALDLACCRVEDTAVYLRVDDELRSLQALTRRADALGSEPLWHLAGMRRMLLEWRVAQSLGDADLPEVAARLRSAADWRRFAIENRPYSQPMQRQHRLRVLRESEPHVAAALRLLESPRGQRARIAPPFEPVTRLCIVGDGPTMEMPVANALADAAVAVRDPHLRDRVRRGTRVNWLRPARRVAVPGARPKGVRVGAQPYAHLAALDRVDAVRCLFAPFNGIRTKTLLNAAHAVGGEVLRDVDIATGWLGYPALLDPVSRRALIVYLGALGFAPRPESVLVEPADAEDAAAWALAIVLADPSRADERLPDGEAVTRGGARELLALAARRVASGHLYTAIA